MDPATGRFTQEDPIGLAGGLNLYGFANGDPVTFSDPFGLRPCREGDWWCLATRFGWDALAGLAGFAHGASEGGAAGLLCGPAAEICSPIAALGMGLGEGVASVYVADQLQNMNADAGKSRGANRKPNQDVERIVNEANLNDAGRTALHNAISKKGMTLDEIKEIAQDLANQAKYRNPDPPPPTPPPTQPTRP